MNKISKKIVALATMAAFVLTLVPAAAFAAPSSNVAVQSNSQEVSLTATEPAEATVDVNVGSVDAGDNFVIWVEQGGQLYQRATYKGDGVQNGSEIVTDPTGVWAGRGVLTTTDATTYEVTIVLPEAGTYTVKAGVSVDNTATDPEKLSGITVDPEANTIKVVDAESEVSDIAFSGNGNLNDTKDQLTFKKTPNGINAEELTLTVTNKYVDSEKTFTTKNDVEVVNPYGALHVQQNGKDTDVVKTGSNGEATISIIADYGISSGVYTLKFTAGDVTEELKVNIPDKDAVAQTIQAVKMENNVVASDKDGTLENAVQFIVKDADGNEMDFGDLSVADTQNVKVTAAPEEFYKLPNADKIITLAGAGEDEVITLNTSEKLPVGEYTVKVAIAKGANADATFVVKKFDQKNIVELKLVATNTDVEKTSEVAMGAKGGDGSDSKYAIKPVWVDANGVTKVAEGVNIGLKAGTDSRVRYNANPAYYSLVVPTLIDDGSKNDNTSLIGAVVTIQAVDPVNGFNVSREFTVVDPANTTGVSLAFDSDNGSVEKNNKVEVTILDADGNKTEIKDTTKVYAYVADKSNEDAYVQVTPSAYKNGKATLTVYADKATTADIVVSIVDDSRLAVEDSNTVANSVIYGGTLKYTFGEKDVNADKLVAMTIGSSDYIVDNDVVAGDAAPYIDSAWRTMVPIRALAETFGATVDFKDNVITIVDGDTTIVMTVGETAYTVNDEEATMNTAPVIGEGDRAFVPVRFVAEALGYTVTPLQDANGLTASVVFQK